MLLSLIIRGFWDDRLGSSKLVYFCWENTSAVIESGMVVRSSKQGCGLSRCCFLILVILRWSRCFILFRIRMARFCWRLVEGCYDDMENGNRNDNSIW